MPDYKAMYYALFNTLTDTIEILQKAQQEGEQMFIEQTENAKNEPVIFRKNETE